MTYTIQSPATTGEWLTVGSLVAPDEETARKVVQYHADRVCRVCRMVCESHATDITPEVSV